MTQGAIIQARLSSQRLPGKVLLSLSGKPMLQYVVEAAQHGVGIGNVVVATSTEASDDAVAAYCAARGIACYRGSLTNVAERFLAAAEQQGWDGAVRISGDSPLLDWRLIKQAVQCFAASDADLVTNVFPRTYPHGQSVEVLRVSALQDAYRAYAAPAEFEHVTSYFYTHPSEWRIKAIIADRDVSHVHMSVDSPDDLRRITALVGKLRRPLSAYTVADLVAALEPINV